MLSFNMGLLKPLLISLWILHVGGSKWPPHTDVDDEAVYDYIIVGAGTAGCIIANRLSEDKDVKVLVIEAGGDPPDETDIISLLALGTKSDIYWNYKSEDTHYSGNSISTGKVLGGSSTVSYFYYTRGNSKDYDAWVNATGDESWSYENLLPYFTKSENLNDMEILNSPTGRYHGQNGEIRVSRDLRNITNKYLEAFHEVGHKLVDDITGPHGFGFTQPMFTLTKGVRQSTAEAFLKPIKKRPNLHIMKNTEVNIILLDDDKNAIGVKVTKSGGQVIKILGQKEIILSAGLINTPKILMLSGIGPRGHLESLNIPVLSDLPVGENYQDYVVIPLAHSSEETTETIQRDRSRFPVPTFVGFTSIDKSQNYPDYYSYNLVCKNNPTAIQLICSSVFQLDESTCTQFASAGQGREILMTAFSAGHVKSRGKVQLRSTNPEDPPKIYTSFLSDDSDLESYIDVIEDFVKVAKSSYFSRVGGKTLELNLKNCGSITGGREYWKCYIRSVMTSQLLAGCTCPMGSVLDSSLRVHGVQRLRVADASAMPNIVAGGQLAVVMAIAEKAADLIKQNK